MADPKKIAGGTLFHVLDGESPFMYAVDMRLALARYPAEWKERPWTQSEIAAYKRNLAGEHDPEPDPEPPRQSPLEAPRHKGGRPRKFVSAEE